MNSHLQLIDFVTRWLLLASWFTWALYTHKRINRLETIGVTVHVKSASDITKPTGRTD